MREIKFRGKRVDNSDWCTGYYLKSVSKFIAIDAGLVDGHFKFHEVISETVGQLADTPDKHSRKVYEGDIVKIRREEMKKPMPSINEIIRTSRELRHKPTPKVWGSMLYRCGACKHMKWMYLEVGVEGPKGKQQMPCPFCIRCPKCGKLEMVHVGWAEDEIFPERDIQPGESYFSLDVKDGCGRPEYR